MKKIFALLVLCLECGMVSAISYNGVCGDDITWSLNTEDSVLHLLGSGKMTEYSAQTDVPWDTLRVYVKDVDIDGRITSLNQYILCYCENLAEVSFPDHLKEMPSLRNCSRLHRVKLSQNLTKIPSNCFNGCTALDSLYIYDNVTTFQTSALAGIGNLRYVSWGKSVRTIGDKVVNKATIGNLFYRGDLADWCSTSIGGNSIFSDSTSLYVNGIFVDSLYIPDSVTSIGKYAFANYHKLRYVSYKEGTVVNPKKAFEGLNIKIYVRDEDGVESVDYEQGMVKDLTWRYTGSNHSLEFVEPSAATTMPDFSLSNPAPWSNLPIDSVSIGYHISRVGNCAFANMAMLRACCWQFDLISIGDSAFYGCTMLHGTTTLPHSVDTIGRDVFAGCVNVDTIQYYHGLKFGNNSFPQVNIVELDTFKMALTNRILSTIILPDSTLILSGSGDMAAGNYPWRSIKKRIAHIRVTDSITSIPALVCSYMNKVRDLHIDSPLQNISSEAFHSCSSLATIKFPRELKTIGARAFHMCKKIESITCLAETPPQLGSSAWGYGYAKTAILYVPASSIPLYKAAEQWKEFDIQPILMEIDSISPDTVQLTWPPVDSVSLYQLHLYTDSTSTVVLDTTLLIQADSLNGGIMVLPGASVARRIVRIVQDDHGSIVIIIVNPTSGTSEENPYKVTVSTVSGEEIRVHYDMNVYRGETLVREESGSFVLNEDQPDGIENLLATSLPTGIYDLYGHRYPAAAWETLPAGVYVVRDGEKMTKVMRK